MPYRVPAALPEEPALDVSAFARQRARERRRALGLISVLGAGVALVAGLGSAWERAGRRSIIEAEGRVIACLDGEGGDAEQIERRLRARELAVLGAARDQRERWPARCEAHARDLAEAGFESKRMLLASAASSLAYAIENEAGAAAIASSVLAVRRELAAAGIEERSGGESVPPPVLPPPVIDVDALAASGQWSVVQAPPTLDTVVDDEVRLPGLRFRAGAGVGFECTAHERQPDIRCRRDWDPPDPLDEDREERAAIAARRKELLAAAVAGNARALGTSPLLLEHLPWRGCRAGDTWAVLAPVANEERRSHALFHRREDGAMGPGHGVEHGVVACAPGGVAWVVRSYVEDRVYPPGAVSLTKCVRGERCAFDHARVGEYELGSQQKLAADVLDGAPFTVYDTKTAGLRMRHRDRERLLFDDRMAGGRVTSVASTLDGMRVLARDGLALVFLDTKAGIFALRIDRDGAIRIPRVVRASEGGS